MDDNDESPTDIEDDSQADVIKNIAEQSHEVCVNSPKPAYLNTHFHKIVLGGNVSVVRQVIHYMTQNGMSDTLRWLIKASRHDETIKKLEQPQDEGAIEIQVKCHTAKIRFLRGLVFVVLGILSTAFTPIFYFLHKFAHSVLNRKGKRISANVQLPLFFAAMSQDDEMLALFISEGVKMTDTDEHANNVFHYIADLSSVSPQNAIHIFDLVMEHIDDLDHARHMITHERNSSKLTPFEYAAKFGSPSLMDHILKFKELLHHTTLSATKNTFYLNTSLAKTSKLPQRAEKGDSKKTNLCYVDVTEYEAGSLGSRSAILSLLSDRDVVAMSEQELMLFEKGSCMWKWIQLKVKQVFPGVICFQLVDMFITALLLVVFNSSLWASLKPDQLWVFELEIGLKEFNARANNSSFVFREDRHLEVLNRFEKNRQLDYMEYLLQEPSLKTLIFETAANSSDEVVTYFQADISNWNLSDRSLPYPIVHALMNSVIQITDDPLSYFFMHFTYVMNLYAMKLVKTEPELFRLKISAGNRDTVEKTIGDNYERFTFTLGNAKISPAALGIGAAILQQSFCMAKDNFNTSDIRESTDINPPPSLYGSSCALIGLRQMANTGCKLLSVHEVYAVKEKANRQEGFVMATALLGVAMIASCIYIFIDIIERLAFIYTCIADGTSCTQMIMAFLGSKLPGSYARKQFNVLTYLGIPTFFIYLVFLEQIMQSTVLSFEDILVVNNFMFVAIVILRILMHIHATRLFPRIGHFVITTFMMGENLLHFSVIFGTILFIFSLLFHLLVENPTCSVEKLDGFQNLVEAMFSTFKLTFSLGDFGPSYNSDAVKFTYSIYVIIVGLLFMNLIIAVMGTTATTIMSDPWKEMTWQMEWLDEATSVEFTSCVLSMLFRCCRKSVYWQKRAGYVVNMGKDGDGKVFIELLDCSVIQ